MLYNMYIFSEPLNCHIDSLSIGDIIKVEYGAEGNYVNVVFLGYKYDVELRKTILYGMTIDIKMRRVIDANWSAASYDSYKNERYTLIGRVLDI